MKVELNWRMRYDKERRFMCPALLETKQAVRSCLGDFKIGVLIWYGHPNRTKKLAYSTEKQTFSWPSTQGDVSYWISKEHVLTKRPIIGPVRYL